MPKYEMSDLFFKMKQMNATDLHLASGFSPIFRVKRELIELYDMDVLTDAEIRRLLFSIMNEQQRDTLLEKLEYDFSYGIPDIGRFRINAFFQKGSMSVAIRRVPFSIPAVDELGLPHIIHNIIDSPRGLILVTGPTGQGKSTSVAAMIDELNENKKLHIVTIEDPIEYIFSKKQSFVMQREVGSDTLSFPSALRAVLREDPDVIFVGEMRDFETISTTLTAAETGHLVFATLHTNSAAQSVDRIIDVFPPYQQNQIRAQLAAVLLAIFSQQLIVTADHSGMVLACEVLIADPAIRNLIREGNMQQIPSAIQTGKGRGMQTMEQSLKDLVMAKKISEDQAYYYAFDKDNLKQILVTK